MRKLRSLLSPLTKGGKEKMIKGDIAKLSDKGLEHLYKYNPQGRERAKQWRWEFRGISKKYDDVAIVKRLPQGRYENYHINFIEKAEAHE